MSEQHQIQPAHSVSGWVASQYVGDGRSLTPYILSIISSASAASISNAQSEHGPDCAPTMHGAAARRSVAIACNDLMAGSTSLECETTCFRFLHI